MCRPGPARRPSQREIVTESKKSDFTRRAKLKPAGLAQLYGYILCELNISENIGNWNISQCI